jgi:peptide/nickel transport system permease protein
MRRVLGRAATLPVNVLLITLVTFVLAEVIPADPARVAAGLNASAAEVAHVRRLMGLDRPLWVQYVDYLGRLVHGNLGLSYVTHVPVAQSVAQYLPASVELIVSGAVGFVVLGIGFGLATGAAASLWGSLGARVVYYLGMSLPIFWLALILQLLFYGDLGWLPAIGQLTVSLSAPRHLTGMVLLDSLLTGNWPDLASAAQHLVLPAGTLALARFGVVARYVSTGVQEAMASDYVRTARAKGVGQGRLLIGHVLRNVLIPVNTIVGLEIGWLLAGSVLVEVVFSWPGLGYYAWQASVNVDLPAILGVTLVYSRAPVRAVAVRRRILPSYLRRPDAVLVALLLLGLVVVLAWPGLFTHLGPDTIDPIHPFAPPGPGHPWGTDEVGRDIMARVLYGARQSVPAGVAVSVVAALIGVPIGLVSGYAGGTVDAILVRLTDFFLGLPALLIAIAISAALGPGLVNGVIATVVVWWPGYARLVRASVQAVREREFVNAARAVGASEATILFRHILPNVSRPIVVKMSMDVGIAVVFVASLGFIGLGAQPPAPEWGAMIADAQSYMLQYPWTALYPGLAILVTAFLFNLMGDVLNGLLGERGAA